jgi:hypothetical protein
MKMENVAQNTDKEIRGVHYNEKGKKWIANITINGKKYKESFQLKEEAVIQLLTWQKARKYM